MRTVTNMYIANLAFADVTIALFAIPFQFHAALLQVAWLWLWNINTGWYTKLWYLLFFKVLSFKSLFWFHLLTLTFQENSNHGQENYWKSGVRIPALDGQNFFCLFSVHLQILHKKLHIFDLHYFGISCFKI